MNRVEDKKIRISHEDFPVFLYESRTVYDGENEDLGLFRGYVLVRVSGLVGAGSIVIRYRRFTGPSLLDHRLQWIRVPKGQTRQRQRYSSLRR